MMCSTWKISVFGIVALMLAFGLTAGDAIAHSDGHSSHAAAPRAVNHFDDATLTVMVTSSTLPVKNADGSYRDQGNGGGKVNRSAENLLLETAQKLRATEVLDQIVFTYKPGRSMTKEKNIVLTIPGGWTQPVQDNIDGMNEPGEIKINQGSVSIRSGGGGWRISTGSYDPAPTSPVKITYKRVTVPKRAGDYQFGFTSNVVGGGHVSQLDSHLLTHARAGEGRSYARRRWLHWYR